MPCPRCSGLMLVLPIEHVGEYETRCLLCGHRDYPQAFEPIEPNPLHRWESVLCDRECGRKAVRGREQCRECAGKGELSHSERIKAGLQERREREVVA